jgi:hypothetical protein
MSDFERIVRTQTELDQAVADKVEFIGIRSEAGVWLTVTACDSSTVRAYGSSTVTACDSSTVTAYGSSTVTACDSSTVTACDSSTVRAYGSSTVTACGSSTVTAYGSSTVTAYGSSTVTACGSSTVRAYGSSTVTACDSSTVRACDSSTVRAGSHTAVHLHSGRARIDGGVVIDHLTINEKDPLTWCGYYGVQVVDGVATVYKAVDDEWTTCRGTDYSPGSTPRAPVWSDNNACGGGLHFGPTPGHALAYHREATRFVAVGVALADLRPIVNGGTAKCKAPRVVRACVAVDEAGRELQPAESAQDGATR